MSRVRARGALLLSKLMPGGRMSRLSFSSPTNNDHARVHVIESYHSLTNRIPPPGRRRARRRKNCAPGVRNLPRSRSSRGRTSCRTGGTTARTRVRTTTSTRASSSPGTERPASERGERGGRVCFRKGLSHTCSCTFVKYERVRSGRAEDGAASLRLFLQRREKQTNLSLPKSHDDAALSRRRRRTSADSTRCRRSSSRGRSATS